MMLKFLFGCYDPAFLSALPKTFINELCSWLCSAPPSSSFSLDSEPNGSLHKPLPCVSFLVIIGHLLGWLGNTVENLYSGRCKCEVESPQLAESSFSFAGTFCLSGVRGLWRVTLFILNCPIWLRAELSRDPQLPLLCCVGSRKCIDLSEPVCGNVWRKMAELSKGWAPTPKCPDLW